MSIARRLRTFIEQNLLFTFLLFSSGVFTFIGGYALFSETQARSTLPLQRNWRPWFILGCYAALATATVVITGRRARIMTLRLKRISTQTSEKIPIVVHEYIQDEFWRTAAITYLAQPKGSKQSGWGHLGSAYANLNFRRTILDTVHVVDTQARNVLPHLPVLRPHVRMGHHLRILAALVPADNPCLKIYDSAIQKARYSEYEPTQTEFEMGMRAYQDIIDILSEFQE